MTTHTMRIEQYYNALVSRGRHEVAPSIREARTDLKRVVEARLPVHGV